VLIARGLLEWLTHIHKPAPAEKPPHPYTPANNAATDDDIVILFANIVLEVAML
jgi:hypothetical protein